MAKPCIGKVPEIGITVLLYNAYEVVRFMSRYEHRGGYCYSPV